MREHETFQQGIACQPIGPVQTRAGNLSDGIKPAQARLPIQIGFDASALVVGGE